jgi:hypothetical protein
MAFSAKGYSPPKVAIFCPDEELKGVLLSMEKFKEVTFSERWNDAVSLVERGKVHGAIRVAEDFIKSVKAQEKPEIEVVLDEAAPTKAAMITATIKGFIEEYFEINSPVELIIREVRGITPKQRMLDLWLLLTIILIGVSVIPLSLGEEKEKKTLDARDHFSQGNLGLFSNSDKCDCASFTQRWIHRK